MINVVNWSGGHDSTVMLHYLLHKEDLENLKVVFVDSSIIIPDTFQYIDLIVKEFGIKNLFTVLKPQETFFEHLVKYNFWPSIRALWCRKLLKLDLLKNYYNSFDELVTEYLGISLHDSAPRARMYKNFPKSRQWGRKTVFCNFPLLEWPDEKKKEYMRENHIPENPVYKTFGLSGCYFCPYYHEKDYLRLKKYYPALFQKLCHYEAVTGKRALPDFWISKLKEQEP